MEKVSFYGLSGSGKSCYIFAFARALGQGIRFADGKVLTVRCPQPTQMVKLFKAYQQMAEGQWPAGNVETVKYNFNCKLALSKIMNFGIDDYRGGLLNSIDEDDEEEQKQLFKSFEDSSVLLFFVGADTIKAAMAGDIECQMHIDYMNTLYENYLDTANNARTPICIVISKSDMLTDEEKPKAKRYIEECFRSMFGRGTNITATLTMVTLGKNLSNNGGELEGTLIIGATSGNIHIPIVYSLYCVIANEIEKCIGNISDSEEDISRGKGNLSREMQRSSLARFFSSNEGKIKAAIESASSTLREEKERLDRLNDTLTRLKDLLVKGADLYIDGIKQS